MKRMIRILLFIVFSVLFCKYMYFSLCDWLEGDKTPMVEDTYIVTKGDTLWGIATTYKPNSMSYEQYIHEVTKLNNNSSELKIGQELKILREEEK